MYRMKQLVPNIGPTVVGPLGVMHLPRMWLKGILSSAGLLPGVYFDNYKGFNLRVVDAIGLEPEAWFAFLKTTPTYAQAEAYVKANATKLDADSIAAINTLIQTFPRPEENAAAVRARVGIDDPSYSISARLIDVDDWFSTHEDVMAHRAEGIEPLIPMVSSAQTGPAGIPHLPRLWMKAFLSATGALHPEWKTGTACGFDKRLASTIDLDLVSACDYITKDLPDYLTFERWVGEHIAKPSEATKAEWVKGFAELQKPEEASAAECIECGLPGAGIRNVILLNDMVDWKYMHDSIAAQRATLA